MFYINCTAIGWGETGYEPLIFSCIIKKKKDGLVSPLEILIGIGFSGPCLVIIVSYLALMWRYKANGKQLRELFQATKQITDHLEEREGQLNRTSLLLCVTFIGLNVPGVIIMTVDAMPPNNQYPALHVVGYMLFWCSGFVNPLIYVFFNTFYRYVSIAIHYSHIYGNPGKLVVNLLT
jgi:hypothetical protein